MTSWTKIQLDVTMIAFIADNLDKAVHENQDLFDGEQEVVDKLMTDLEELEKRVNARKEALAASEQ
jgi:hypothetical protein